ncbi:hypothetical protein AYO38_05680 [bacterium SCGC AG-212-C10]|nr:hypothetical protein AYO38_05680 [bacterium SCGC AG-212-C10]
MIYILTGKDMLAIERRIAQLRDEADGGSGMLSTNLAVFAGRDAKPGEVLAAATAMPFLSPKRMVIVEELLERFEVRYDSRSANTRSDEPRALKAWQPFIDGVAAGLPPTTTLILTGKAGARNGLVAALSKLPDVAVEDYAELKGAELYRFVREEAALHGVRFRNGPSRRVLEAEDEWQRPSETDPAVLLANLHPEDTVGISNELQKLALYTLGREATVDDIDIMCGGIRDASIFNLTDAIQDGNLARTHAVWELLRLDGMESPQLFASLLTSYRLSAQVLDLLADGLNEEAIGIAINRKWAAGRQMAIRRARNLGPDGVRKAYEVIVGADRGHKQGDIDEPVAVDLVFAQLCLLATATRR